MHIELEHIFFEQGDNKIVLRDNGSANFDNAQRAYLQAVFVCIARAGGWLGVWYGQQILKQHENALHHRLIRLHIAEAAVSIGRANNNVATYRSGLAKMVTKTSISTARAS